MIAIAWYLLKVTMCSGILCGYYYIALRNKIFHRWNRFYLLASIVLALAVPLMKINIFQKAGAGNGTVIRMLQTITNSDEIVIEYNRGNGLKLSSENIIGAGYLLVSCAFLSVFFIALYKIYRLKKTYPEIRMKGISFFSTDAKGTPFSFFNSIFWNNAIDLHSKQGHKVFNHEIAHVKEKHSYDKVFMNVVLLFFWTNPFFWIMRKELSMIHEFIADKEALEDDDINAFAEMVLQTVYPGQQFSITSNFFHSPLKRRLLMFTKNKNPKASYVSRLLVLPLAAVVFFAFTFKMKTINAENSYSGKKITVVIDAGHGGDDEGAIKNSIKEKDLTLAIAKAVKELNKNENLRVVLSRTDDELLTPKDRTNFAEAHKADIFVSIHIDAESNKNSRTGVVILVPKDGNVYVKESKLLGSAIVESFKGNNQLPVSGYLEQINRGVWVLNANQFPAVLIEAGFLTTQTDFDYIINPANQQIIATNILNGIERYAQQNLLNESKNFSMAHDTIPGTSTSNSTAPKALFVVDGKIVPDTEAQAINSNDIMSVTVLKGEDAVKKYGEKGKDGVVEINKKESTNKNTSLVKLPPAASTNPVYFADEKEISAIEMKKISPNSIESINVLKGENATKKYGEKGKNGVVEIITKKAATDLNKKEIINDSATTTKSNQLKSTKILHNGDEIELTYEDNKKEILTKSEYEKRGYNYTPSATQADTIPDKVFTKVENEAEFPGGKEAWLKYIASQLQKNQDKFTVKDFGTCLVKFIVNTDGSVSNIEDSTMKNTQLAKVAVEAIRSGPKWIPATQNNQIVAAYRLQPITLTPRK